MLEAAERKIYALRKDRSTGGLMPVSVVVQNVYDQLSEAAASESAVPGLTTGIGDLDRTILGMGPGDLILIASRPGMGKTSMGAEHRHARGPRPPKRPWPSFRWRWTREQLVTRLLAGDGPGGQPEAADGPAELRRVAAHQQRGQRPQRHGPAHRRQPLAHRLRHERPVPPPDGPGAGGRGLPAADAVGRQRPLLVEREPHPGPSATSAA